MAGTTRLVVGRVDRAHGLNGELVVSLTTNRHERVAPRAVLYAGERVLVVERSKPHLGRFIVVFEGVASRRAADELHGAELTADAIEDPEELWVHELVGATVVDQHGITRGVVTEVEANPASDLLVLDSGALVPIRFVTDFVAGERIAVDVPEGLFD